jgi:hypothetical protein
VTAPVRTACASTAPWRRRRSAAAGPWQRGSGKSEAETAEHQTTCTSLKKKPLLSEIN